MRTVPHTVAPILILASLLLSSCDPTLDVLRLRRGDTLDRDQSRPSEEQENDFTQPEDSSSTEDDIFIEETKPEIYVCGVENPESEDRKFVIFKDGVRSTEYTLPSISVSATDADAHFLVRDEMYVALTEGDNTNVYKNGILQFSYPAKEYITHLIRRDDGIWTLGVNRSGDGFALRRDGNEVYSKLSGTPGRLYEDDSHIYFDYHVAMGEKTLRYLVKDGDDYALTSSEGDILAVCVSRNSLWLIINGQDGWIVSCGNEKYVHQRRPGFAFRSAELFSTPDGCAAVISLSALGVNMPAELVCIADKEYFKGGGSGSYHYFDKEPDAHITFTKDMDELVISGYEGSYEERLDSVRFEGKRCAMQYEHQLYLCCTPMDGSSPFIWKRGNQRMNIDLDGYLTGIYVGTPP